MTSTWHADSHMLGEYARGSLSDAVCWSVEAHLPTCGVCRRELAQLMEETDRRELVRLRGELAGRMALVPQVSSRRSVARGVVGPWWAWAGLVAAVFGAVVLLGLAPVPASGVLTSWAVVLAPLAPLSMVATVYALADSDPAAAATPRGGLELALVRTLSVLAVAIPTVGLAMSTVGAGAVAWLLPGLALCVGALALGPTVGIERGCVGLALVWCSLVLAASPPAGLASAGQLIEPSGSGHVLWATVLVFAVGAVAVRRGRFDLPGGLA